MTGKLIVPRLAANRDVDKAIDFYLDEGAKQAALDFVDELEKAYALIGDNPGIGNAYYSHELNLPGLRSWPMNRFPYIVFYVENNDYVDVWRVLHGKRDVATWMSESTSP